MTDGGAIRHLHPQAKTANRMEFKHFMNNFFYINRAFGPNFWLRLWHLQNQISLQKLITWLITENKYFKKVIYYLHWKQAHPIFLSLKPKVWPIFNIRSNVCKICHFLIKVKLKRLTIIKHLFFISPVALWDLSDRTSPYIGHSHTWG